MGNEEDLLKQSTINQMIMKLTGEYVFIGQADILTGESVIYLVNRKTDDVYFKTKEIVGNYTEGMRFHAEFYVVEKDRERFLEETSLNKLAEYFKTHSFFVIEYGVELNGEKKTYQCRMMIDPDDKEHRNLIVGIRDITASEPVRFENEKMIKNALEAASAANKAKSTFLFNMSHDIRTPMNSIFGFTDLAEKNIDDKENLKRYLHNVRVSGNQLLEIIDNVLEMARIENGVVNVDLTPIDFEETREGLNILFLDLAKKKNITVETIPLVKHRYVYMDKVKVGQVALNIITNAIKYTPNGGHVEIKTEEFPCDKPGYAQFVTTVTDTGIGMAEDFIPHIFDIFTRERTSTESKVQGTGLGMGIVKKLVDLMGGTIDIKSTLGKGTSVSFSFFHKIATKEEYEAAALKHGDIDITPLKGKRVLIAEDIDLNREIAEAIFEDTGAIIKTVCDGQECIDELTSAKEPYDVILMDMQMPVVDGLEATRRIRNLSDGSLAGIPIIAMTANSFEEDKRLAHDAGMNDFITKPINAEMVFETIIKVIDK